MIFVDANIPMYARGKEHPYRAPCRRALERIARGEVHCCSSAEVVQELFHRYLSLGRPQDAEFSAVHFMAIVPEILPVTKDTLLVALDLMAGSSSLPARDLLHLAVMRQNVISEILSVDRHFDGIAGIRRVDPLGWDMIY